jgi:hypothetical protein
MIYIMILDSFFTMDEEFLYGAGGCLDLGAPSCTTQTAWVRKS